MAQALRQNSDKNNQLDSVIYKMSDRATYFHEF